MRTYEHERVYIPLFGRGFESSDCSAGLTILTAELYDWGFAKYAIKSSNNWRDHRLGQTGTHHLQLVSRVGTFRGQSPQGLHSGTAFRAPLGSWGMTCPFQLPLDARWSVLARFSSTLDPPHRKSLPVPPTTPITRISFASQALTFNWRTR